MSNQLRFEGNDLESLLERVRSEAGPDAKIIAANRLRKGGVGGFFAKEVFEVVVEPVATAGSEEVLRPAARLGRARKASVRSADHDDTGVSTVAVMMAEPVDTTELAATSVHSVLDLVDEIDEMERGAHTIDIGRIERSEQLTDGLPSVSTQTERFAEILERLAISNDSDLVDDDERDQRDQPVVPTAPASPVAARDDDFPTYDRHSVQRATPPPAPAPEAMAPAAAAVPVAPRRDQVRSTPPLTVVEHDELIARPESILANLGVPARFVPRGVSGSMLREALRESFTNLPVAEPLPDSRGVTVAIVGIGARPVALARVLAAEQNIDPDTVVIATEHQLGNGVPDWLQITDPEMALERRRSWRRRDHVSFVAISVPSMTAATEWANAMLDRLEPTQTWAVANACWKVEDVNSWANRLGGFDVLALERLDETVSPASLLDVGIPVARLDGDEVTAEGWTDLLLDRVVLA